jgi:hypothetical protein
MPALSNPSNLRIFGANIIHLKPKFPISGSMLKLASQLSHASSGGMISVPSREPIR